MRKLIILIFTLACVIIGAPLSAAGEGDLQKVTYLPHWLPQAQFAGFIVAEETGIYEKHGLDVEILTGGPDFPSLENLKKGKADFASAFLCQGIECRAEGAKIVNILQLSQRSALMLVAKKSSGINRPEDLNGRKVGLWEGDFEILPKAFFKKYGLETKIVPIMGSVNLFLEDGIDATTAMWYNEYHTIINCGLNPDELTDFFFYDYGDLNFPEDGVYCLEEKYLRAPAVCKAFALATIEGWEYAFDHPEMALEIVMRKMAEAFVPANRAHQAWMLARMKDLIKPEGLKIPVGCLNERDYRTVSMMLKDYGLIPAITEFTDFYKGISADD